MSKVDPIKVAERTVVAAEQAGADASDAYIVTSSNLDLSVRNGEIESLERATTFGLGLRLTVKRRTVFVHTTAFGGIATLKLIENAVQMAEAMPEPKDEVSYASNPEVEVLPHPDPSLVEEPHEAKVARLREIEEAMLDVKGVTRSGGVSWGENDGAIAMYNSKGLKLYAPFCQIGIGAEAVAERGDESSSGGAYYSLPARGYLPAPEAIGRQAGRKATGLLGARPVKSCRVPVIFTPDTGWAVLAYLTQPLNAEHVTEGRSYLADHLGKPIAASGVTIRDNAHLLQGPHRCSFDGEGTPTRNTCMVKGGVLQSYFTSRSTAAKLGMEPGGNTRRDSYANTPEIGPSNYYMEPGPHSREEIIRTTDRGLMLENLSGWWVGLSPATDTFSSAAKGYWIEKGEIAYPVKGISVGGSLREMLMAIDRVGDDLVFTHETRTPTFRVAEMAVSGT